MSIFVLGPDCSGEACLPVALFGGTFDPIHSGHLTIARTAKEAFQLEQVLIIPAAQPPHKINQHREPYIHRFRMVEIACGDEAGLVASRLEEHPGNSYSVLTIKRAREQFGAEELLYFLIGADAFADVGTWFDWQTVLQMVEFIVVSRPGHRYQVPEGAIVHRLETLALSISSSEIRRKLEAHEAVPELPAPVLDYILSHRLYGS